MTDINRQYREIGERIYKLRKARLASQADLVGLTGISSSKLSRIERGEERCFLVSELLLIAEALKVPVEKLLAGNKNGTGNPGSEELSVEEKAHRFRLMEFDRQEYRRIAKKH